MLVAVLFLLQFLCLSYWFASCLKNPAVSLTLDYTYKIKERSLNKLALSSSTSSSSVVPPELEKVLKKEYGSFFSPMNKQYYAKNVEFIDPLNTLIGIDKYQQNVDMLAGRTTLGNLLFKDATISLHDIEILSRNKLQTRWTLQVTVKSLPWQPRPRFTGISVYTLNDNGIIIKQEDYWDSINLANGKYNKVSFGEALGDFLGQIQRESGAEMSAPELPVTTEDTDIIYQYLQLYVTTPDSMSYCAEARLTKYAAIPPPFPSKPNTTNARKDTTD